MIKIFVQKFALMLNFESETMLFLCATQLLCGFTI